jgi:competence protein CoiA
MLSALREDGTLLHLLPRQSKEVLRKIRKESTFFCSECQEQVTLKVGTVKMEHFAHRSGSICIENYERESEYHLNGKIQLFHWLQSQKLEPQLETYYEHIRQRSDIGIRNRIQDMALEFQCSTIPQELMLKRTSHYKRAGIKPLWILGGKNIKRKGEQKVSLSNFDYLFLMKTPSDKWYIPTYCSVTKRFIFLMEPTPISSKNALTQFLFSPLMKSSFSTLLNPPINRKINVLDWMKELRSQKLKRQFNGTAQDEYLRELYQSSLNLLMLPAVIGLPVYNAPMIETPPLIWQTYLFIDVLYHKAPNDHITFSECYIKFTSRVQKGEIKLRTLPLVQNCNLTIPLMEYLQLLVRLRVLERINMNTFVMKIRIRIPESFSLQQAREEKFYLEYGDLFFNHK